MTSSLNGIRVALESHLVTEANWFLLSGVWSDSGQWRDSRDYDTGDSIPDPALPSSIAWPNVPFTPTTGAAYLRTQFMPALRRPVTAGPSPEQRHSGMFFVSVYTPEDQGADAGMSIADRLCERFDGSTSIIASPVIVRLEYAEAKLPLHDPPFYVIPVEISWYSYVS